MRFPGKKSIAFFFACLIVGYGLSWMIMAALEAEYRFYGFGTLTLVAVLIALILVIIFDKPLKLETFEWTPPPEKSQEASMNSEKTNPQVEATQPTDIAPAGTIPGAMFPYNMPTEHDVDLTDPDQAFEGSDLPVWILAGWAAFILWAVIYLIYGLPGTLQ